MNLRDRLDKMQLNLFKPEADTVMGRTLGILIRVCIALI